MHLKGNKADANTVRQGTQELFKKNLKYEKKLQLKYDQKIRGGSTLSQYPKSTNKRRNLKTSELITNAEH